MYKSLLIWCLVSTAFLCFTHASPTIYKDNGALAQREQLGQLSVIHEKRDYGIGDKKLNNDLVERAFPGTIALGIAQTEAAKPGATLSSVLLGLFNFIMDGNNPTANRVAHEMEIFPYLSLSSLHTFVNYLFQEPTANRDTKEFVLKYSGLPHYTTIVAAITIALVPQQDNILSSHDELDNLVNFPFESLPSVEVGRMLSALHPDFPPNIGKFATSLVVEVLVAVLAVAKGEAQFPQEIVEIMASSSQQ